MTRMVTGGCVVCFVFGGQRQKIKTDVCQNGSVFYRDTSNVMWYYLGMSCMQCPPAGPMADLCPDGRLFEWWVTAVQGRLLLVVLLLGCRSAVGL
jgi:hypothetical protein